jgi:DNA polymerase III sliding clamp (beta) subunit (PCNA family)
MDFRISTASLQQAVKNIGIVARINTTDPTGLVLISAQDNSVTFAAKNDNSISCTYTDVSVKTKGEVAVEFGKFKSFIMPIQPWNEEYGSKECHIRFEGERKLKVTTSQKHINNKTTEGRLTLPKFDPFVIRMPSPFGEVSFTLSARLFKDAINKTIYTIDPNDSRPFLQGIYMTFDASKVNFVGTNGRLLSEFDIQDVGAAGSMTEGAVLFRYDFMMAVKRAAEKDVAIEFSVENDLIKARFEEIYICGTNIIGREYPEYKHLFDSYKHEIVLGKDIIMDSLRSMVDILNQEDNFRLTFQIEDKKLSLLCDMAQFDYGDDIEFEGKFSIDINGKYLMQTIDAIMDDKIIIRFLDDKTVMNMDSFNFRHQRSLVTPLKKR